MDNREIIFNLNNTKWGPTNKILQLSHLSDRLTNILGQSIMKKQIVKFLQKFNRIWAIWIMGFGYFKAQVLCERPAPIREPCFIGKNPKHAIVLALVMRNRFLRNRQSCKESISPSVRAERKYSIIAPGSP